MTNEELATEVRHIARSMVKNELKRQGIKPSCVKSEDITKAASVLLWRNLGSMLRTAKRRKL